MHVLIVIAVRSLSLIYDQLPEAAEVDLKLIVLKKRYSENMQQMYRRAPMPKCDFNKVAKQLY